jgi:rubrerythrin
MATTTVPTSHHYRSDSPVNNPVDDQLYDLLQVLTSKCEAIEAYAKYEQDADDETRKLFGRLAADDAQHATQLLDALRKRLNGGSSAS